MAFMRLVIILRIYKNDEKALNKTKNKNLIKILKLYK